ncbi:MAG: hypothetical protein RL289_985 [Actinomycetota bacterium]
MSNGFDGKENDQAWVALTANDPAQHLASPELGALKASVLSQAIKVSPISKRSWLAPVAVAASVALFVGGGAGYTIAAQSAADSSSSISAPSIGMGGASPEDAKMSSMWGGRAFLEADSGISDTSGSAIGYTFDASDIDRKAQLKIIADIFSVSGEITGSNKDGYFVGDQNYVKAVAQLSGASWDLDRLITWNYSDSSVSPTYCGGNIPMYDTKSSGDAPASVTDTVLATPEPMPTVVPEPMPTVVPEPMPVPSDCTQPSGDLPSDESALALAKEKFGALNFNSEAAVWSVVDGGGMWGYTSELAGAYKLVTANVLIDEVDTNQSWSMTIGPDSSILNASGFFARFVPTAEYKIVGSKTAIERSQSGLWTNLPPQEVYKAGMVYPMELGTASNPSAVAKNSAGQPIIDANIDRIKITKAEPSLISWYLNDGSIILLPAYLLSENEANDSRQWLQLAIADEYVDFN